MFQKVDLGATFDRLVDHELTLRLYAPSFVVRSRCDQTRFQLTTGQTADVIEAHAATRAVILVLVVAQIASFAGSVTGGAGVIDVDPEVRALANVGRVRVLVTLLVGDSGDETLRAAAIGRAQDTVLSRLPRSHGSLLRRYASVPLLSLEVDATALLALEQMPDVVAAVKLDRTAAPQ